MILLRLSKQLPHLLLRLFQGFQGIFFLRNDVAPALARTFLASGTTRASSISLSFISDATRCVSSSSGARALSTPSIVPYSRSVSRIFRSIAARRLV